MKQPKIDWPRDRKMDDLLEATGKTQTEITELIEDAIGQAEQIAKRGLDVIAPILRGDRSTWESAWNRNATLTKWLGKVTAPNHVKDAHRRLEDVYDRLADKELTVRVRAELPQDFQAQNLGGFLSPSSFKVAPEWIGRGLDDRAVVVVHELLHEWFIDQKIDGDKVYGSELAAKLAREDPKEARRSPENYEQFLRDVQSQYEAGAATTAAGARR